LFCVIGSIRNDEHPVYLMDPDLAREVKAAFHRYEARWCDDEVDHYDLKELLGLGDFRVQFFEVAEIWWVTGRCYPVTS